MPNTPEAAPTPRIYALQNFDGSIRLTTGGTVPDILRDNAVIDPHKLARTALYGLHTQLLTETKVANPTSVLGRLLEKGGATLRTLTAQRELTYAGVTAAGPQDDDDALLTLWLSAARRVAAVCGEEADRAIAVIPTSAAHDSATSQQVAEFDINESGVALRFRGA